MQNQKGQALLLILLTMAVVLVVVLSVLSRTITDITVTTKEEEALRAFSAAEAGIEKALIAGDSFSGTAGENASFTATVTDFGGEGEYVYPEDLFSGETVTFWFVDHDDDTGELTCDTGKCFIGNQMRICWGQDGTSDNNDQTPAIEISVFYDIDPSDLTYADVEIARVTADPHTGIRRSSNNFDDVTGRNCSLGGQSFEFWKDVDFSSAGLDIPYATAGNLLFAKVRFFYNANEAHGVGIDVSDSGDTLPSQGKKIESIGTSGEANRKVEVYQTFGELPPIFDAVLFSPVGGVTKTN